MLENYFTEGSYRFQMTFGRGSLSRFFGRTKEHDEILSERRHWLKEAEDQCLALRPEGEGLLREALAVAVGAGTVPELPPTTFRETARSLGMHWEPDYLLLSRSDTGIRLVCACVCFPSSWSVEEKIGKEIGEIHEVVPGLNAQIGRQIHLFLEKLRPGAFWTRSNWGLSRSPERNQHPARGLPRLDASVRAEEVFFRVEEQALAALPETNGILFGIRIKVAPLNAFQGNEAGSKLRYALETMPEEMARYKGLSTARHRILELLG